MFSSDQFNTLMNEVMSRLSTGKEGDNKGGKNKEKSRINLSPSQAIVILGILAGALDVDSVLVDRNQEVQVILSGSLKRKTQLEKIMDQVGTMPFDEVMKTLLGRY